MRQKMRPRGCVDEDALVRVQSIIAMETRYRFQSWAKRKSQLFIDITGGLGMGRICGHTGQTVHLHCMHNPSEA